MQLSSSVKIQVQLTDEERKALFSLYNEYYDNVDATLFFKDLAAKDFVIIVKDQFDIIQGFSTIQLIWLPIDGTDHLFLYSGDTIIRENARSQYELSGAFIHIMFMLDEKYADVQKHWFLISKGFRTYRFLPVYFKAFYPRYDLHTPSASQRVLDAISIHKFGEKYNPTTNIIQFQQPKDCLKEASLHIPAGRLKDPHIRFFLSRNPGYRTGDELACITNLHPDNYQDKVFRIKKASKIQLNSSLII